MIDNYMKVVQRTVLCGVVTFEEKDPDLAVKVAKAYELKSENDGSQIVLWKRFSKASLFNGLASARCVVPCNESGHTHDYVEIPPDSGKRVCNRCHRLPP